MRKPGAIPKGLDSEKIGAYFRPRDLQAIGISHAQLGRMVRTGHVERLKHGLYRNARAEQSELETIAMICSAVPRGIVCLLTALRIHEIGTQAPREVWIALDRRDRKPSNLPAQVRVVRFSPPMRTYGVQQTSVLGVRMRITSPARTVVDCFRYRSKIGIDVALEALRDVIRSRKATVDEITRAADVCHARTVMRTYLEALTL